MSASSSPSSVGGGQLVVDALRAQGVDTVFCVPGESYLAVLDALHDANDIRVITCRQEGGAAFMAEAYAKATGQPGVLMVTRGPGACNASIGVHTAFQDSTPMIVCIGQVGRGDRYREAFQEVNYERFFGELTKWTAEVQSADRIPELFSQAFHRACSGRPGPVALSLPEDMLRDAAPRVEMPSRRPPAQSPGAQEMAAFGALLASAKRPLMLLGGPWSDEAFEAAGSVASRFSLPTAAAFRCQDRMDNTHPCYAGDVGIGSNPKLLARLRDADLLIVVGARLGEMTSQGYTLPVPGAPTPGQQLVHVHPDPQEPGRVFHPALAICATPTRFLAAAATLDAPSAPAWAGSADTAHAEYLAFIEPTGGLPGDVDMGAVMRTVRERLPADAILTTDAGNFSGWMHRHYVYQRYPSQLGPTNGAMGYAIPAAIAARLAHPRRPAVAFVGDGGAMMSGQELATAMHHGIDPVILVINNGMYGTIRMHQERDYPDRRSATALTNPDFAAWARSFGAFGETVTETAQFAAAFDAALTCGRAAVVELRTDPEAITTSRTLSQIRGTGAT